MAFSVSHCMDTKGCVNHQIVRWVATEQGLRERPHGGGRGSNGNNQRARENGKHVQG